MYWLIIFLLGYCGSVESISVHGKPTYSRKFPYQASLRFISNGLHHCSGTIISNRFLLTAGHCVCAYYRFQLLYAVLGANSFVGDGDNYTLETAICHSHFDFERLQNDIALIKVQNPIAFTKYVKHIPIVNFEIPIRSVLLLSKWGYMDKIRYDPKHFYIVFLTRVDNKYCERFYPQNMITNKHICTYSPYGVGACIGDSGGPVVYNGLLAGLVSFGKSCMFGYPDVNTKLSAHLNWIQNHTGKLS